MELNLKIYADEIKEEKMYQIASDDSKWYKTFELAHDNLSEGQNDSMIKEVKFIIYKLNASFQ